MDDKFKEKYHEMEQLNQQVKQAKQQLEHLSQQFNEIEYIVDSLEQLKELKEGDEILAPVSNGIFIKAKVTDAKKLKVNVGTDTVVEKSVDDTKKLLSDQSKEIEKVHSQIAERMEQLNMHISQNEEEIKRLIKDYEDVQVSKGQD